jgi:hypothetical protein
MKQERLITHQSTLQVGGSEGSVWLGADLRLVGTVLVSIVTAFALAFQALRRSWARESALEKQIACPRGSVIEGLVQKFELGDCQKDLQVKNDVIDSLSRRLEQVDARKVWVRSRDSNDGVYHTRYGPCRTDYCEVMLRTEAEKSGRQFCRLCEQIGHGKSIVGDAIDEGTTCKIPNQSMLV